jgi:aryl-alcohol dehydrogenase-like predicted oxidoreductase
MLTRRLGRSNLEVLALGLGCWAIGGVATGNGRPDGRPIGWGQIDDAAILKVCEDLDLASICNRPLAMGLLTGKYTAEFELPGDDVRSRFWNLRTGPEAERLENLQRLREILTAGGRTLAQAALGWIWARSPVAIPIPGFKTVAQVEDNAGALRFSPLAEDQMRQVEQVLRG